MRTTTLGDDLVVARRAGDNIYLSKAPGESLSFSSLNPGTLFFRESEFDQKIRHLKVPSEDVEAQPVSLTIAPR